MNGTATPGTIFFYRIPLARRMKNHIPQGWMIPHIKIKITETYILKESHMTGDEVPVGRE